MACLQWVSGNLCADLVFDLGRLVELNLTVQPELSERLVDALMGSRRLFRATVREPSMSNHHDKKCSFRIISVA